MRMYELKLTPANKKRFLLAVKEELKKRNMSRKDLAEKIGRPLNSVYDFFATNGRSNRYIAAEIADALNIRFQDWRDR